MEYKTLEIRVGFTIFVAVLVFTVGLMWFEGFKVGRKTYEIQAVFPMVGGIDRGDAVDVNGVEKGEVREVALRERDAIITISLETSVVIPADSKIFLQTRGIMGERAVSILLGSSGERLAEGAVMQGIYDPGISEALAAVGAAAENLQRLVDEVERLGGILTDGDRLATIMDNLAAVSGSLREGLDENLSSISEGMNAFGNSAARVDSTLARNSAKIDSILARLDSASGELPELLAGISEVTRSLGGIARRLETSDNTLGALVQDRELLDKLEKAITGLDELVADIKKNPGKYLKVEIF
ncbi:MAG: MlaD family protein [Candidatus Krumholzibacteria bacterium]|jgi:phospholipid/cholesterol/gamma-HCH transport system substrate-binding protein|nr:MlaD family protein [Candidatus Krumholzibacteria bacterium]